MKFQDIPVEQFSVRVKSTDGASLDAPLRPLRRPSTRGQCRR